jgi:phosphate butyryltransferase
MDASIGAVIKKIREKKHITRENLARIVKIKATKLEEIEEKAYKPSVSDLLRIAGVLNIDIATLISGEEPQEKRAIVTRNKSRVRVEHSTGYTYESLAPAYCAKHIEPFVIIEQQRDRTALEFSSHSGEEFHYVIQGTLCIIVDKDEHTLNAGDSVFFDSSLPHALYAIGGAAKLITVIYNGDSMLQTTRSKCMRDLIGAAKLLGDRSIAVVCPGTTEMAAINTGIEEGVIRKAYLIGDTAALPAEIMRHESQYVRLPITSAGDQLYQDAMVKGLGLVTSGDCQMLMKGHINTSHFVKEVLNKKNGVTTDRRLSLVSIFELPEIDRLIFLTDPGINPALVSGPNLNASVDIIKNAIDVAHALGVVRPKVALLEANELPSLNLPATLYERQLSTMKWDGAEVYGPLSYDIALYQESAKEKGLGNNIVAGKADILVVPYISGGNFLYKAWTMTMNAEVANVVLGAKVPLIINSRSDSDKTKFLTMCVCAVYSQYAAGLTRLA